MTRLVVIDTEKQIYRVFEGRQWVASYEAMVQPSLEQIEEIRTALSDVKEKQ